MAIPPKLFRALLTSLLLLTILSDAFGQAVTPLLDGAKFGYPRTSPLRQFIGPNALPTLRYIRGVGGVAFVREAAGLDGWSIATMKYDAKAQDGQRLIVTFSKQGAQSAMVRPSIWDWELVPLIRFVSSDFDAAFSWFGEAPYQGPAHSDGSGHLVTYHPAFKDTLLGLRLMQLDLYLFIPPFTGYLTDAKGTVILGSGELEATKMIFNPQQSASIKASRRENMDRLTRAWEYLTTRGCAASKVLCDEGGQPFDSYIVGDMISPVWFSIADGRLSFNTRGVCWDFSRPTEPDEASSPGLNGIKLLRPFSESFCDFVRKSVKGINPLVYRSANRALTYSALLRHFKKVQPRGFSELTKSVAHITIPTVQTPTEVFLDTK